MPDMAGKRRPLFAMFSRDSCQVSHERLRGANVDLTSFVFRHGGNVYVFSYEKDGKRRHTLVDAGDPRYRRQMLRLLAEKNISPANIERIILTHRHYDHWGLAALLSKGPETKVLAHSNFRSFVEDEGRSEPQMWPAHSSPAQLKACDFEYLSHLPPKGVRSIGGTDFPVLADDIGLGDGGKLMILACPECTPTHSPDQIVVIYSSPGGMGPHGKRRDGWRPTDDIVFGGDLWLMRAPLFDWGIRNLSRRFMRRFNGAKDRLLRKPARRWDAREQDSETKDALKRGFAAVRVKPGHGDEFIGSQLIPKALLADRDLLVQLSYSMNADKSILRQTDVAPKVKALREQAYTNFVKGLLYWTELGFAWDEMPALLVRIYEEQSGGSPLVRKDRAERRERLKETLASLRDDEAVSMELRKLGESALAGIERVSSRS